MALHRMMPDLSNVDYDMARMGQKLRQRVGKVPPQLVPQVQHLSVGHLASLNEAVLDFKSVGDLQRWLDEHSG